MNQPFFSVIIPTLNEEKYLPHLLNCLKKQTFKNFEVIVVDAHSKDQTRKKAKKYPGLKLIISPKRNPGWQRNLGAKKAQGKYLIFIDADATFNQKVFRKAYQFIRQNTPAVFFPKFKFNSPKFSYKIISVAGDWLFFILDKLKLNLVNGQFLVIKKSVFKQIKGYNSKLFLSEEHDLIKKTRKLTGKVIYLRSFTVNTSIRRMEKEGLAKFLLKYLYFIFYEHLKGPVYQKSPLNYPMGGSWYD